MPCIRKISLSFASASAAASMWSCKLNMGKPYAHTVGTHLSFDMYLICMIDFLVHTWSILDDTLCSGQMT